MADMLLSALIPIVLRKASDAMVARIGEMWGIDQQRERLHDMLLEIQANLPDAEVKAISNAAVKSWLQKLKSAAYDAEDLLDEFCYEERRQDAVKRGHKTGSVSNFFSPENSALFSYKMSDKLKKTVGRIDGLVVQMGRFNFAPSQIQPVANRVRTDSVVIESEVVGRDEDKDKIVKLLLERSGNIDLTVVPLVGMGGLGKTTLAQLVHNDPSVNGHFNLRLWVCVSEEFNISLIVKSIIELDKGDCNVPVDNMELLQRRLCHVLDGKRYLLVLDDVWNENFEMWERLRALLNCGDPGSAIIVTTRSGKVASMMGTVESYNLEYLGKENSWSLFQKRAFSKGLKECQELVEVGRKIVEKCRGLPLAINTLGSLMSYKHELHEWFAVLESEVWEQTSAKDQVLPILRLSYDHLPSYMKQCFAFCAVFPKDYEMDKDELIQFWMANGFIPSDRSGSLEMKGRDIFNELSWRSFFQNVRQSIYGYRTICNMHDLMHDLAQSIMEGECLSSLEVTQHNQRMINVRHISLRTIPLDINKVLDRFPIIRSLIRLEKVWGPRYVRNIGFVNSNSLRILKLNIKPIEKTMINPEKMKHLRYLEISSDNIKSIPEEISTLYLLQTLKLDCWRLEKLPEGVRFMSSLRHLCIAGCTRLRSMPSGLGQLCSLQTLTDYIIGTDPGNGIGELENLNLHGRLNLFNLEEVEDASDAVKAKLIAKKNLDWLLFCWMMPGNRNGPSSDSEVMEWQECNHLEVLDALKPCSNLKVLEIKHYRGKNFPDWVTEYHMLYNLIELDLTECRWCKELPPIKELPCLQILKIEHLDNVRHLCYSAMNNKDDADAQIVMPSLEKLYLSEMPNLFSWCEDQTGKETLVTFPVLKVLLITNCPKLTTMPITPLLDNLYVEGNVTLSCFAVGLTTLRHLSLGSHDREASARESLSFQPWESLMSFSLTGYNTVIPTGASMGEEASAAARKCKHMQLTSCNFLLSHIQSNSSLWFWKCFAFLEVLYIGECDSLVYWPEEEFRNLNCLRDIIVDNCSNFVGSQVECSSEQSITEALLPKLQHLTIEGCPNFVEIPICSASIWGLCFNGCQKLQCLPEWLGRKTTLKYLIIGYCISLNALPSSIGGLTSLKTLKIRECHDLAYLPEGMEGLKALEKLTIRKCPKIKVLPEGLLQQLNNLDELSIKDCPDLERHFQRRGKYRHLISKIRIAKIGEKLYFSEDQEKPHNMIKRSLSILRNTFKRSMSVCNTN